LTRPEDTFGCNAVDPDYFDALAIGILRGRPFSPHDDARSESVVIVNETMARRLWPGQDPLGRRVLFPASAAELRIRTVVGVARDSKYINVYEAPLPYVYIAMRQEPSLMRSVYVRSALGPEALIPRLLREIQALDPEMPVADLRTMKQTMAGSWGTSSFGCRPFRPPRWGC
jgi:putative ABC transport system permease protein